MGPFSSAHGSQDEDRRKPGLDGPEKRGNRRHLSAALPRQEFLGISVSYGRKPQTALERLVPRQRWNLSLMASMAPSTDASGPMLSYRIHPGKPAKNDLLTVFLNHCELAARHGTPSQISAFFLLDRHLSEFLISRVLGGSKSRARTEAWG